MKNPRWKKFMKEKPSKYEFYLILDYRYTYMLEMLHDIP